MLTATEWRQRTNFNQILDETLRTMTMQYPNGVEGVTLLLTVDALYGFAPVDLR